VSEANETGEKERGGQMPPFSSWAGPVTFPPNPLT